MRTRLLCGRNDELHRRDNGENGPAAACRRLHGEVSLQTLVSRPRDNALKQAGPPHSSTRTAFRSVVWRIGRERSENALACVLCAFAGTKARASRKQTCADRAGRCHIFFLQIDAHTQDATCLRGAAAAASSSWWCFAHKDEEEKEDIQPPGRAPL